MTALRRLPGAPRPGHRWSGHGGVTLAGDSWGEPGAPLVVLLHGGGQTRHAWKGAGRRLAAAGFRTVAYDARGHGDSGWDPDGRYEPDDFLADLVGIVEALGDPHPVLVGASLGGGTSLLAAGEGAVDASALVLVDVAPQIELDGISRIRAFMHRPPEGFASLEEIADRIRAYQPHRRRPANLDGLAKNVRVDEAGRYHWHWDPVYQARDRDLEARQRRLDACARALRVPTLLVRGASSDILSEEGAQSFLQACPHAAYVNVLDAAHMVAGDRNDVFVDAVASFLLATFADRIASPVTEP